jgi:hypothetical protein
VLKSEVVKAIAIDIGDKVDVTRTVAIATAQKVEDATTKANDAARVAAEAEKLTRKLGYEEWQLRSKSLLLRPRKLRKLLKRLVMRLRKLLKLLLLLNKANLETENLLKRILRLQTICEKSTQLSPSLVSETPRKKP